ncbi:cation:dicarboxylase symporter family transporter [Pontibacillus yanchengensis]|uniref:Cation:dicarboxylase symporter family transporter n=2 Tax=Pontibacillus yanchengensis TaxID=462910 RepID=A0ACC7VG23_9BACI|nr:dicarboxylate/amino acid:cation symporter [Pontibacillus yanchengensis]MYL35587.1 cation:dicarboxylase symporter family transporter [Pontibacillus yanchengensis]MYL53647.1 cation:dicarboxylase symporter family transporter [Pontibacillus yanchengensis]
MKIGLLPRLIIAIIIGIGAGLLLPQWWIQLLATFNGLFGGFLNFIIPLIILGFIAPGIGELGKGAGKLVALTTTVAYTSTVVAGLLAFFSGRLLFPTLLSSGSTSGNFENPEEFLQSPLFEVNLEPVMSVMTALILAFVLGLGLASINGTSLQKGLVDFRSIIEKVIHYVIIPLLPVHILGIFANMTYGGQVAMIMSTFIKVFAVIIVLHVVMLLAQYSTASALSGKNVLHSLRNMVPAYFTALGTQSSATTIPVTLKQTKSNQVREKIADFVVPLCANIHLSGSTITLVSCSMAVMMLNGMQPTFTSIFPFILALGLTMIAAPGVPGGAVMAVLGLLQSMLGFSETMTSLMIALYLAQDSFGTATNVTGDGALSIIIDKLMGKDINTIEVEEHNNKTA